jgi:hypothetical protein
MKQVTETAAGLLSKAEKHMLARAETYDSPDGERSMGKAIEAFNILTGRRLEERDGWLLMVLLKIVRNTASVHPHKDSIEDAVAYAALYGESCLKTS